MDQTLPRLYKEYGTYSNFRNFPLDIDGLKPVERRVLFSAYKIARNKFVKSRKVDSYTTGNYHPHGSCYGSIVQLVRQGFLIGQGNFGSNIGVEPVGPAADRYTECKLNSNVIDLIFKYIKYVPKRPTELGDIEPVYLPTMIPICLLGNEYTQGVGFGFRTFIPCYDYISLKNRLLWLLGVRKTEPIPVPISDCTVTASNAELKKLLTTGKNKISVEGIIKEDPKNNKVILKSWPPGKRFETILNKFSSELGAGTIGFTDLSSVETEIVFQVLRERNRDKIYKDFVKKLKDVIKGDISFEITVVDINNVVSVKPVDQMLLDTYEMFYKTNEQMINEEIVRLTSLITEYKLLERIRPVLSGCIKDGFDVDTTLNVLKDTFKFKDMQPIIELINKYKIMKLLTLRTETNELEDNKKELNQTLKELDKFTIDQYSSYK